LSISHYTKYGGYGNLSRHAWSCRQTTSMFKLKHYIPPHVFPIIRFTLKTLMLFHYGRTRSPTGSGADKLTALGHTETLMLIIGSHFCTRHPALFHAIQVQSSEPISI